MRPRKEKRQTVSKIRRVVCIKIVVEDSKICNIATMRNWAEDSQFSWVHTCCISMYHIIIAYHPVIRYGATEYCAHLLHICMLYHCSVVQVSFSFFLIVAMSANEQLAVTTYSLIHEHQNSKRKKSHSTGGFLNSRQVRRRACCNDAHVLDPKSSPFSGRILWVIWCSPYYTPLLDNASH